MSINLAESRSIRRATKGLKGLIVWRGLSLYNQKPIMVVLRFGGNTKTGAMHTIYIVPDNGMSFNESRQTGEDCSNCGDCDLRGTYNALLKRVGDRLCYVVGNGLHGLYESIRRGNYGDAGLVAEACGVHVHDLVRFMSPKHQPTRLGGWGDAAFVPPQVWRDFSLHNKTSMTSYTHQWRWLESSKSSEQNHKWLGQWKRHSEYMRQISMASCHSPQDVTDADAFGWRKFITVPTNEAVREALYPGLKYEILGERMAKTVVAKTIARLKSPQSITPKLTLCAADKSHVSPITCDGCPIMCDGRNRANKMNQADVWIYIHGSPAVIGAWKRSPHWQAWLKEFQITQQMMKEAAA